MEHVWHLRVAGVERLPRDVCASIDRGHRPAGDVKGYTGISWLYILLFDSDPWLLSPAVENR